MKQFTKLADVPDPKALLNEALQLKKTPLTFSNLDNSL